MNTLTIPDETQPCADEFRQCIDELRRYADDNPITAAGRMVADERYHRVVVADGSPVLVSLAKFVLGKYRLYQLDIRRRDERDRPVPHRIFDLLKESLLGSGATETNTHDDRRRFVLTG